MSCDDSGRRLSRLAQIMASQLTVDSGGEWMAKLTHRFVYNARCDACIDAQR